MPQPASKRLVTEQKLTDTLNTELPKFVAKQKNKRLVDTFTPALSDKTSLTKIQASVTYGSTYDGLIEVDAKSFPPSAMYDISECNWNENTLASYGDSKRNMSKPNGTPTCFDFTTLFEGTSLVVSLYKTSENIQDIRVWVDDAEVVDWYRGSRDTGDLQVDTPVISCVQNDTNNHINLNFTNRGFYKIRVAGVLNSGSLGLLRTNPEGFFYKPKKARVFGVISDLVYETASATNTSLNAGTDISTHTGWTQWNMAAEGSGFVSGLQKFNSDSVFTALAKAPTLDLLIVNGSVSDLASTTQDVLNAMRDFFNRFRLVRPNTPIVWQGLFPQSTYESTYTIQGLRDRELAQQAVALADPNVIGTILPAKENWITGTGKSSAKNGTGNQDFQIGPDGLHLSSFGCRVNGRLVAERLADMSTWIV